MLARYVEKHPPATTGEWAGLIFTMPDGKPIGESTLDWAIKQICRTAGLEAYRWHDLRHHYVSVLIAGGENPKVVQKRLGHRDIFMTLRIYSHLFAEAEEQTRSVLDAAWEKAREEAAGDGERSASTAGAESSSAPGRIPESRSGRPGFTLVDARSG